MKAARHIAAGFLAVLSLGVPAPALHATAAGVAPAAGLARPAAAPCTTGRQVGQVQTISQGLRVKHLHQKWNKARANTPLYQGDLVQTNQGQRAAVRLCDGSMLYLNQRSEAQLPSRRLAQVKHGEVAESVKQRAQHEVKTSTALAQGRNTRFDVKLAQRQSRFIVAKGLLQVRNKRGTVRLKQNQQTVVRLNQAPARPTPVDAQAALSWTTSVSAGTWHVLTAPGVLHQPVRPALDSHGNIYVTDSDTDKRVVKLSPSGRQLAVWHLQGTVPAPLGIAVDAQDNVYVTSEVEGNVQKFTSNGQFLSEFGQLGTDPGQFLDAEGVEVDTAGNIYVADGGNNRIQKFSASGQPLARFGTKGSGPGQFNFPNDLAIDSQGNMYVADWGNNRIQKLSSAGQPLAAWGSEGTAPGQYKLPVDVALDSQGNVYVADSANERIQELSPSGQPLQVFGTVGKTKPGEFDRPSGIAVDAQGNIYVADRGNGRIQILTRG